MIKIQVYSNIAIYDHAESDAKESTFTITNECACPGHTLVLECTVTSTSEGGITVWNSAFFHNCGDDKKPEITLLHNRYHNQSEGALNSVACNNGSIIGRRLSVDPENITYTSQLTVTVNSNMIGKTISCEYDDGTMIITNASSIRLIRTQIQDGK